jgi:hypothetical protein
MLIINFSVHNESFVVNALKIAINFKRYVEKYSKKFD